MRKGEKKTKNLKKKKLAYNSDDEEKSGEQFRKQRELLDLDISHKQYESNEDDEYLSDIQVDTIKKTVKDTKTVKEIITQKSKKMGSVLQKILGTGDDKKPVLSLKRKYEQEIDNQKLEVKAKKLLKLSKREKSDVSRVIPDFSTIVYEKELKKIATRGVVQLFNALRAAQKSVSELEADGIQKNEDKVPKVSKQTFLSALKSQSKPSVEETVVEKAVPFLNENFSTKTVGKHWDQQD